MQFKFVSDDWVKYYCNGKGNVKVYVDKCYCFGVVLFVCEIGKQRYNGGGNCFRVL